MLEGNIVVIGGEVRPSNTIETFDPKVSYLSLNQTQWMHSLMKILEWFLVLVHSSLIFLMTFKQDILFVIMSV